MACATVNGVCSSNALAWTGPVMMGKTNVGESAGCSFSQWHALASPARSCSRSLQFVGERDVCSNSNSNSNSNSESCCSFSTRGRSSACGSGSGSGSGSVRTMAAPSSLFGECGDGQAHTAAWHVSASSSRKKTTGVLAAEGVCHRRKLSRSGELLSFSNSLVHGDGIALVRGSRRGRCHHLEGSPRVTSPIAVLSPPQELHKAGPAAAANAPPPAWPGHVEVPQGRKKWTGPKPVSLVGSTGSIGTQTLDIIGEFPERFRVVAMSAGSNITLLAEQIRRFKPSLVSVAKSESVPELREAIAGMEGAPEIMVGEAGMCAVASHPEAAVVVTGIVGCAGLKPTVAAIKAGKDIALANKETLIAGGPYVLPLAKENGVKLLPADSEHSAIFQCLQGIPEDGLRRIILTASGGAFRDLPVEKLKTVTVADALKHPNWAMGKKITIDSATLMNKGLEVIEAHYLFGASYDDIDIVIHPQSIVHSMVETKDSSVLAQLGWPDMRLPIIYTLSWPERILTSELTWPRLDFVKMGNLTFREPDHAKYPAMDLAFTAGRAGGTMTGVLSAANERAVELFLDERISYLDIIKVNEQTCAKHMEELVRSPDLETIVHFDQWARAYATEVVSSGKVGSKTIQI